MRVIKQDFTYSVLCLIAAVLVCGGLTVAVVYLAIHGLQLAAGFIGVGGLAGIVGQIIQGRKSWRQPVE